MNFLEMIGRNAAISAWLREGHAADVAFNVRMGLPGGQHETSLFHYAINGFIFDQITVAVDPSADRNQVIDDFVERLIPRTN
ncbi:hypothetical protein DQ354_16140 [Arthrobacter sp. AQ5-06]|nr:hypothetical protein DQ354_16140 [Arthrobacter sp. AQ5-06]